MQKYAKGLYFESHIGNSIFGEMSSDNRSIDIVIPSFRLDESILSPIIHLPHPEGWRIFIYLIADNPHLKVPESFLKWQTEGKIHLIVNTKNEGPSETRNIGIRAGSSQWILLLDDDICPMQSLLEAYTAVLKNGEAIGYVGVTDFPEPINAVTKALEINGSLGHFRMARYKPGMVWAPTANLMLNRNKLDPTLFDPMLKKSGEDIEFLSRNSFLFGEKYVSVPNALVKHPWWDNGGVQTKRMFRYGEGASEISCKPLIKKYTYYDFTNTSETLLLLLLTLPFSLIYGWGHWIMNLAIAVVIAEYITNWIKAIWKGNTCSPLVGFHLMWVKNCYEAGYLFNAIKQGRWSGFTQRLELGFIKENPGSFRTNRWKIIKTLLLLLCILLLAIS